MRREVTLALVVYGLYLLVRAVVLRSDGRARARRNAERIVAAQERLGIGIEPALQRAVLRFPRTVHGLNIGYAAFNVTLTVGWLVLLYRRRDPGYHELRRACQGAYVAAQPIFLLFPTEPPRALEGFVDTMSEVSGLDLEHPVLVRLYNPVAAMPSLPSRSPFSQARRSRTAPSRAWSSARRTPTRRSCRSSLQRRRITTCSMRPQGPLSGLPRGVRSALDSAWH